MVHRAAPPIEVAQLFFSPWPKSRTLLFLFAPFLFLPLRSPVVLVSLPLLAQRFLSSRSQLWTTEYHYSAPIMVILVFATADALSRIKLRDGQVSTWLASLVALVLWTMPMVDLAMATHEYPQKRLRSAAWEVTDHMRDQRKVVEYIPAGTCVEADDRLAPHLTRTNRVTLPTLTTRQSDFVILDASQTRVGFELPSPAVVRERLLSRGYVLVHHAGDLTVYQRPGYAGPSPDCGPLSP